MPFSSYFYKLDSRLYYIRNHVTKIITHTKWCRWRRPRTSLSIPSACDRRSDSSPRGPWAAKRPGLPVWGFRHWSGSRPQTWRPSSPAESWGPGSRTTVRPDPGPWSYSGSSAQRRHNRPHVRPGWSQSGARSLSEGSPWTPDRRSTWPPVCRPAGYWPQLARSWVWSPRPPSQRRWRYSRPVAQTQRYDQK